MKPKAHNPPLMPEELREIRKDAGLSQSKLARLFGLTDARTVRRYESGEFIPPGPVVKLYHMLREGKL